MRPTKFLFVSLFIVTALTILWSNQGLSTLFSPKFEKKQLPTFALPTLYSPNIKLTNEDFRGKVSLFIVWSSGCHCCRHEHGMLMKIKNNYQVPIYGLNFEDEPKNARDWLNKNGNPYILVGVDEEGKFEKILQVYGTPEIYIIDKQGFIRYRHMGEINQNIWNNDIWPRIQTLQKES